MPNCSVCSAYIKDHSKYIKCVCGERYCNNCFTLTVNTSIQIGNIYAVCSCKKVFDYNFVVSCHVKGSLRSYIDTLKQYESMKDFIRIEEYKMRLQNINDKIKILKRYSEKVIEETENRNKETSLMLNNKKMEYMTYKSEEESKILTLLKKHNKKFKNINDENCLKFDDIKDSYTNYKETCFNYDNDILDYEDTIKSNIDNMNILLKEIHGRIVLFKNVFLDCIISEKNDQIYKRQIRNIHRFFMNETNTNVNIYEEMYKNFTRVPSLANESDLINAPVNEEFKCNGICHDSSCNGRLFNYKCNVCNKKYCAQCFKEFGDKHECIKDDLETVKYLKQNTRSCPNCFISIIKTEGCDMMFCTNCFVAFSWETKRIYNAKTDTIHNPHYYEHMRNIAVRQNRTAATHTDIFNEANINVCGFNYRPRILDAIRNKHTIPETQQLVVSIKNKYTIILDTFVSVLGQFYDAVVSLNIILFNDREIKVYNIYMDYIHDIIDKMTLVNKLTNLRNNYEFYEKLHNIIIDFLVPFETELEYIYETGDFRPKIFIILKRFSELLYEDSMLILFNNVKNNITFSKSHFLRNLLGKYRNNGNLYWDTFNGAYIEYKKRMYGFTIDTQLIMDNKHCTDETYFIKLLNILYNDNEIEEFYEKNINAEKITEEKEELIINDETI